MSLQEFGGFETGLPSADDVQARLDHQAGLLTNVIGGLYAPLDSAMTYQSAQLAGPVKALRAASTRAVNGVGKMLAPIGDTLDTVVANRLGEQGGSLANMQGAVAAAAAAQPTMAPMPTVKIGDPSYAGFVPSPPVPSPIQPITTDAAGLKWGVLYSCSPPASATVARQIAPFTWPQVYAPQVQQMVQGAIFDTADEANAYLAANQSSILAPCQQISPTLPPVPISPPVLVPPPVEPMPVCADPSWLLLPVNTPGKAVVGSPAFTVNGYNYYYGGPSPYVFAPYVFYGESLLQPGLINANSTAYLDVCKPTPIPIGSPPPPTPIPIGSPPPPPPPPCCPDWDDLIKKLCKCLHAIHVGQQPVDLDQPLAFLFGEQRATWHPKAIAFYGTALADIVAASTLQDLRYLRESVEGQ